MADGPHQAVVRDLQRPGRQLLAQHRQRRPDIRRRQLPQRPGPDPVRQRPDAVPVQLHRPHRSPRQPMLQPVVHRRPDGVPGRRLQTDVELSMQRPELVPDLLLRLAGDLPAQALAVRAEPDRDRADVPVLVCRCPVTSKIPRRVSLTCQEESVLSIFARQRVRFARFACLGAVTRDSEVCLPGRLGDHFGRFPGCMNVSASVPSAAGRGKLSGRRRRSSTTNWQKGKFDVRGQPRSRWHLRHARGACPVSLNLVYGADP